MIFTVRITDEQVKDIAECARILNERDPTSPYASDKTDQDRILTTLLIGKIFVRRTAERGSFF